MDAAVRQAPSYATRIGDVHSDKAAVLDIWRGNLGDAERMAAKYSWFYEHAPSGPPLLQLLEHAADTIGAGAIGRRRFLGDGQPLRGGVLVDLAVVPDHRSLGPAMILQQGLLASARNQLDLLYGFPNPKAAPVFKRMGYTQLGTMVRHVRVLRHRAYLQRRWPTPLAALLGALADGWFALRDLLLYRRPSAARVTWRDRVDPRIDQLWQASAKIPGAAAIRDEAYLRWRFDDAPGGGHRYLLLEDPESGTLHAWFAVMGNQGTLRVLDFWSLEGACLDARAVAMLVKAARAAGFDAASVELSTTNPPSLAAWRQLGFVERSRRPIFGVLLDERARQMGDRLHLTAADEDEA